VSSARGGARVRHLYVHLPFCVHRCGYCDFVTLVGRDERHGAYVDALVAELALEREHLAPQLETLYLGGGTPTLTARNELARLLDSLPAAPEVTVEANPETVTPGLAGLLYGAGVTRVSLGAQSFQPHLLEVLERRAGPDAVRRAFYDLRDAGFDNISLDLLYGIPGQTPSDLNRDLAHAIGLEPEHLSCYELEAKPGTRFTRDHAEWLAREAEAMEGYFEIVVETLVGEGYGWYETANFSRPGREARHNLAYWQGRDYLGIGIGAVSTVGHKRWRNRRGLAGYLSALADGRRPPRELERLPVETKLRERLMLGLRLERPMNVSELEAVVDLRGVERLESLGLLQRRGDHVALTARGRFVGGGATVALMKG
jgi:oxygen-independent coproporphyrinogen-3 oxidase